MRKVRNLWLLVAVFCLGACGIASGNVRSVGSNVSEVPTQGVASLTVIDDSGDLIIKGSAEDSIRVEVQVTTFLAGADKDAKALEIAVIEPQLNGQELILDSTWGLPKQYGSTVTITAPSELALKVTDGSGELSISDWSGAVSIQDTSGDIILDNVSSFHVVSDSSGNVVVDGKEIKE